LWPGQAVARDELSALRKPIFLGDIEAPVFAGIKNSGWKNARDAL
jgi:hypothetical protein